MNKLQPLTWRWLLAVSLQFGAFFFNAGAAIPNDCETALIGDTHAKIGGEILPPHGNVHVLESKITAPLEEATHVTDWLERLKTKVGAFFPDDLTVTLETGPNSSGFVGRSNKTIIFLEGWMHEGSSINIEEAHAIFDHEFGHFMFYRFFEFEYEGQAVTMASVDKAYANLEIELRSSPEYQTAVAEAAKEAVLANRAWRLAKQTMTEVEILAVSDEKYTERAAITEKVPERFGLRTKSLERVKRFLTPYNELFADFVANFDFRSLTVMADGVYPLQAPFFDRLERPSGLPRARTNNTQGGRPRDASVLNHFRGWKRENELHLGGSSSNDYAQFDPFRGVIGHLFLDNLADSDIQKFIRVYFATARRQVQIRMQRGELEGVNVDLGVLNREFVQLFIAEAGKQELSIDRSR